MSATQESLVETLKEAQKHLLAYAIYSGHMAEKYKAGYSPSVGRGYSPEYLDGVISLVLAKATGEAQ